MMRRWKIARDANIRFKWDRIVTFKRKVIRTKKGERTAEKRLKL